MLTTLSEYLDLILKLDFPQTNIQSQQIFRILKVKMIWNL